LQKKCSPYQQSQTPSLKAQLPNLPKSKEIGLNSIKLLPVSKPTKSLSKSKVQQLASSPNSSSKRGRLFQSENLSSELMWMPKNPLPLPPLPQHPRHKLPSKQSNPNHPLLLLKLPNRLPKKHQKLINQNKLPNPPHLHLPPPSPPDKDSKLVSPCQN
jgi:hypothetical protein